MEIRVMIFEDNEDRRQSLSLLIESDKEMTLVGVSTHANTALLDVEKCNPDIILMDIVMPGLSGIDAVKMIKQKFPHIHIIMQTSFDDDEYVFNAIKNGADGYLLKKADPGKILESIREVKAGGASISPGVAYRVLQFFRPDIENPSMELQENLSDREMEILKLLVNGKSYKMIASEMNISYHTVNSHIKKIYSKLHVNSAGEAIAMAFRKNMF